MCIRDRFQFTPLREGRRPVWAIPFRMRQLFQFTPLREGRRAAATRRCIRRPHFNSRPSARGDISRIFMCVFVKAFQFTPLREGRPNVFKKKILYLLFQFTPLREGRRILSRRLGGSQANFNSRPSARGDLYYPPFGVIQLISIHAPPRGATLCIYRLPSIVQISIHAPPRGATKARFLPSAC